MKRIGLLGGMSWESSIEYYRLVNEITRERFGGLHSADCLLRSVDFAEIEVLQREDRWDEAGDRLAGEARALAAGGAELLVLCTNTMHKVDIERLSVVMSAFHCNTPGASPTPRIATNATKRAASRRTIPLTVVARNAHAPTASRLCTTTMARRLRAQTLASSRNPIPPGPA